jgi:hypothetical protein
MVRNLARPPVRSSFLTVDKDLEIILKKLFVESRPYSDILKSLLVINGNDCLDNMQNPAYQDVLKQATLPWLMDNQYIITRPRIDVEEFADKRAIMIITFDNFTRNSTNDEFRDCTVCIDCISHIDLWDLGDYRLRPVKMMGYIDGILDNSRLSGIGTFQFLGSSMIRLSEEFSGYTLMYRAVHGSDDKIPAKE